MKVSIFGLGYVGTVTSVCLANSDHQVIGVDTNPLKVESINQGKSPIVEPGVDELLKKVLELGNLSATMDAEKATLDTDISLICVGTPSKTNGSSNLEQVMRVADQLGSALKFKAKYHGIVIRSTALPGTADSVTSRIEMASSKKNGVGFGIASNPEFLREGSSIFDFENPPFTVIGTSDQQMVELLSNLYKDIKATLYVINIKEAEILKYACNAFHAVKVAFANEIGTICKRLGIDSHLVMRVFSEDTKLNISPAYLKPGLAFGGSCLPKDVRALTYGSRSLDVSTPLLGSLIPSNEIHIQRIIDWILQERKKQIGILGLSFKNSTDDLRESPIVKVVEILLGKGLHISIYDSNVSLSRLLGANLSYIEREIPHISTLMKSNIDEVLEHAEIILIANEREEFKSVFQKARSDQTIFDLVKITDEIKGFKGTYEGICW